MSLDPGAARERVRVARALGTLPRLARALATGELSYAKVRALTRVATPEIEERLLAFGKAGTALHVERLVRGWRRVDRQAEAHETARRHASRALHVYHDEDGMVVIRGRLAPEVGALLVQALAAGREALYQKADETATGRAADPRRCQISRCSVAGTTARSTRRVIRSIDTQTVSSGSAARTADCCPRCRYPLRCPLIPSTLFERGTRRRGYEFTRERRSPVGWASAWTWDGRSTSCILWRGSPPTQPQRAY